MSLYNMKYRNNIVYFLFYMALTQSFKHVQYYPVLLGLFMYWRYKLKSFKKNIYGKMIDELYIDKN